MTSQLIGDVTVADVRDDDEAIKDIAEISALTVRAVRARLEREHGNTIVRNAFANEWPSLAMEFGELTASAARELDAAARIARITGLTRAGVTRRLNAAHGAKLVKNVFADLWPEDDEDDDEEAEAHSARSDTETGGSSDERPKVPVRQPGTSDQRRGAGPNVGSLVNERYRLTKELGKGGFGVVFKAHDTYVEHDVALKFPTTWRDNGFIEHEFKVTLRLAHPNIIKYRHLDRDSASGLPFLIMEYGGDSSLEALLKRGSLPLGAAVDVVGQIALALDHAHRNEVLHLDVNPGNILLDGPHARLTDFGVSGFAAQEETTRGGFTMAADTVRGMHPAYSAPEVMRGDRATRRSDQFSLAAAFCAAVDGQLPRQPPSPRARTALSSRQNEAVARALQVSPNDRFDSIVEFALALGART
jgi:hypothetical protein